MDTVGTIVMQKYEVGRLLGKGTFAKVYYARCVRTGQSVAIKVIDKKKVTKVGIMDRIEREISVMRLVKHPNIVHLHEVMATKTKIYFVMEYAKGGELFNKVVEQGKLEEDVARKYFRQLINAVEFCHGRGVYHRDLKPENILLDEDENLKVSDFGLSALTECRRSDGLLHTTCGTPAYVAPEIIGRNGYDGVAADVWSCGVVLFVLMAGYLPFHDSNLMEMYRKIGQAEYKFPKWFSPKTRKLLSRMLDPNPSSRISIAKIKGCSWFKQGIQIQIQTDHASSCYGFPDQNKLSNLNAFDIISLSDGLDLSKLFEESCADKESKFISCRPASIIASKLERVAKIAKMEMSKQDGGLLRFESSKESKNGGVMSIEAEIFMLTPVLHLVKVKKACGDAVEYQKILNKVIRPLSQHRHNTNEIDRNVVEM